MEKVAVFATLTIMITVVTNIIVTRLVVIIFYLRKVYKTACICTFLRFSQAENKYRSSFDRLSNSTFYDYPIYSLGDGRIEDMEYVAVDSGITLGRISRMQTVRSEEDNESSSREMTETPTDNIRMSSAEVLRSAMTPLGMNNSLNIQRNENTSGSLAVGMSSFMQNNNSGVPLDRPLFINTAMTAQQRIDIYRRLSSPPQDDEPALLFRWS